MSNRKRTDKQRHARLRLRGYLISGIVIALVFAVVAILYLRTRPLPTVDYRAIAAARYEAALDPVSEMLDGDARPLWLDMKEQLEALDEAFTSPNPATGYPGRMYPLFDAMYADPRWPKGMSEVLISTEGDLLEYLDLLERGGHFARLDAIAECATLRPDYSAESFILDDIDLSMSSGIARSIVRHSTFRVYWMLKFGEQAQACQSLAHINSALRLTESNPAFISQVIGIAYRAVMIKGFRELVHSAQAHESDSIAILLDEMLQIPPPRNMAFRLSHDRDDQLLKWQAIYYGDFDPHQSGLLGTYGINVWEFRFLGSHREAVSIINRLYDALDAWSELPFGQQLQQYRDIEKMVDESPGWIRPFFHMTFHAYDRQALNYWRINCEWNATIIMAAVELYIATHGAPPASLDDLVPGILHELPADPFALDGQFVYERLGDTGEYLLYTVGYDQSDDGGNPAVPSNFEALNNKCPGSDYLIHDGRAEARLAESLQ